MSRRREFLVAGSAGLCALAAQLASFAQQEGKVWRVGVLRVPAEFTQVDSDLRDGLLRGLKDLGYVEGKNLVIEWRFAEGKAERLPASRFETDCGKLQFTSIRAPVRKAEEVATAFRLLQHDKAQGLIVSQASTNLAWLNSILEQAAQYRLPAVYPLVYYVERGGLISYAVDPFELYRRAAAYADRLFKGAKAGDLPIEQPTKFETVINLKTAKGLGITIPDVILLRSDKVIE